ncbi:MAG: MFS transporter [Acidimicrobiia bacterium]
MDEQAGSEAVCGPKSDVKGWLGDVRSKPHVNAWLVYLVGPLAFTGVQLIAPTLPLMQADLGLSNSQLALVSSVYLLPAAVFALPAGFPADRWGRRLVLGFSLLVFGICGVLYSAVTASFPASLAVRLVQGLAFAAILPLTITILGDSYRGAELVRAQGFRTVSLGIGEAAWPIIGGILASIAWEIAWVVQSLAIPVGLIVLVLMTDVPLSASKQVGGVGRDLVVLLRSPFIAALQWVGVQRMFVKFALLAFLPVYLVGTRGFSPESAGLVIGLAAATGVVVATFASRITRRGSLPVWIGASMPVVAATLVVSVTATEPWVILVFAVLHGAADGITGILSNSLVAVACTGDLRATFVAATGALRNLAKFLALGVLAGAGSGDAAWLSPLEKKLSEPSPRRS